MMSMVQCVFCFENCTTEGREEKREGVQISKNSTQNLSHHLFLAPCTGSHETHDATEQPLPMQEPLFVEFADACMKVLHPEMAEGGEGALTDEQVAAALKDKIEEAEEARDD